MFRKLCKIALLLFTVLIVGFTIGVVAVYRAAQHQPDFYQQALRAEPAVQAEAGDSLERSMLDLHNDAHQEGRWQATFTEAQLNGWLAADLPEKFPKLLPPGTKDPRIDLAPEMVQIAARYERGKINSIVSFAVDIKLTEETNQLAVRVYKVRAGMLPVPLKKFLNRITRVARKSEIDLSWMQTEGDPVALLSVPVQHEDYAHHKIYLETIELRDGELYLAGRTDDPADRMLARNDQSEEKRTIQR